MILGVHHIGLSVHDVTATKWLDHVGGGVIGRWATCPNVRIRLQNRAPSDSRATAPRPVNLPGIAHICLQSRDIDEGLQRGIAAGLVAISGPVDLGTPFRYLYAHTRDGVLLELEGAPFVRDEAPRFWIGHIAFVARDIEPLVDFYGRVLNLKPSAVSRIRANPRVDQVAGLSGVDLSAMWLPGLNLGLEFWQYHAPTAPNDHGEPTTGFTDVCFESNDFQADCIHALAQGAKPEVPVEHGLSNCQTASFKDPEGNRFSLIAFDNQNDPMAIANLPDSGILTHVAAQLSAA
jgi:catechol 2,3-dioxygenase-like lactoylglutathione lyase family enzyme